MRLNISFYRIWAVMLGHISNMTQDAMRIIEVLYWPLMDVVSWGYASVWTQTAQGSAVAILLGAMLWNLVVRANYEISVSFLEEVWASNLINLFSSPLHLSEWIIATIVLAICVACVIGVFLAVVVYALYGLVVTAYGWPLLLIAAQLIFSGLWVGILCAALVAHRGKRSSALIFMCGWVFDPFSCVYYAIDVLPFWARAIARIFPMSYTFDAMRYLVSSGSLSVGNMIIGLILNIVYLIAALLIFKMSFEKSRERGLARLVD